MLIIKIRGQLGHTTTCPTTMIAKGWKLLIFYLNISTAVHLSIKYNLINRYEFHAATTGKGELTWRPMINFAFYLIDLFSHTKWANLVKSLKPNCWPRSSISDAENSRGSISSMNEPVVLHCAACWQYMYVYVPNHQSQFALTKIQKLISNTICLSSTPTPLYLSSPNPWLPCWKFHMMECPVKSPN